MKKIGKFVLNGLMMTLCSILMRTVAVSFNVYVANTAGAEAVGLVAGHKLLHGLEYHTELGGDQLVACQGTGVKQRPNGMGQKPGDQRLTRR